LSVASASTVTALTIDLNKVGTVTEAVDLLITGSGVATLSLSSKVAASYVNPAYTPSALKTLNVSGDKVLDFDDSAITTLTTINASSMTAGGLKVNVTGSSLDVAFTGGAGNDVITIGADLDKYDSINGGDGSDTVVISDATLTSSTLAARVGANLMTSVEILGVSATDTVTIDASLFTNINTFTNTAAITGTVGVSGTAAGQDGVTLTFQNGDSFNIGAALTGGAGDASAGTTDGGDGLEVAAKVNTGTDVITIQLVAGAATTITGGAGGDGSGGDGGHAINASTVETINIVTASSLDDLTLTLGASGGSAGAGETAGSTLSVGANATINISGAGDVNLGLIKTVSSDADDLTINGSAMTGKLTVSTGDGNDVITGGSKDDAINAGAGVNIITGGAGNDSYSFADDVSDVTTTTSIADFQMGGSKDVIKFTATAGVFEKLLTAAQDAINSDTTLSDAVAEAGAQLADHETTVFVWQGDAYVVYDEASGDFSVIKLTGITDVSTFDTSNIA
jgi:hypothetical protein